MGLVNTVVPLEQLEQETVRWCREMLELSPFALRLLKASFNAAEDGLAGIQQLAARRQPALLRERRSAAKAATHTGRSARRTSGSPEAAVSARVGRAAAPRGTLRLWLLAARPRTLPAAVARCWSARRWPRPRTTSGR